MPLCALQSSVSAMDSSSHNAFAPEGVQQVLSYTLSSKHCTHRYIHARHFRACTHTHTRTNMHTHTHTHTHTRTHAHTMSGSNGSW